MVGIAPSHEFDELQNALVLKWVFDNYVNEVITDEQVQRILEPVVGMIREGQFDKPLLHKDMVSARFLHGSRSRWFR